jgi:hypothetical protein
VPTLQADDLGDGRSAGNENEKADEDAQVRHE